MSTNSILSRSDLTIKLYRRKYAIFAGEARLTSGFVSSDSARKYLDEEESLLLYWANSAGVSVKRSAFKARRSSD